MNTHANDIKTMTLQLGYSPDPDDAFMWYPLTCSPPRLNNDKFQFVPVMKDIQTLNDMSDRGELEVTALSFHQYPYVADRYALTSCGASMGDGYGPVIVTRKSMSVESLKGASLAIPGERTSAWLACRLMLIDYDVSPNDINWQAVPFDQIIPRVANGEFDAGLIIHEGQLTFHRYELVSIIDLGKWWKRKYRLPLPLGGNAIRRDLLYCGQGICSVLLKSINYALAHHEDAIQHATNFARDMGCELVSRFVGMYVNHWTVNFGEDGRLAAERFLQDGIKAGFVPDCGHLDVVWPGDDL